MLVSKNVGEISKRNIHIKKHRDRQFVPNCYKWVNRDMMADSIRFRIKNPNEFILTDKDQRLHNIAMLSFTNHKNKVTS